MRHIEWLESITTDNVNSVALKAGITPSTVYRQLNDDGLSVQNVVRIASAYGVDVGRALFDTGHVEHTPTKAPSIREASLDELLDEVRRRFHQA